VASLIWLGGQVVRICVGSKKSAITSTETTPPKSQQGSEAGLDDYCWVWTSSLRCTAFRASSSA
jgi:hypothetical protein